ncbi:MAG: LysR family transcriptional regulator [Rhodobacteraceae bacterium]|nr:LysR family transcriptional regulator [Paracoccaceae bacterium]
MNLRQLKAFSAVMDSGLISRAANEIGITQPAVSKMIKSLEEEFGVELFERRKGRLKATPAAHFLNNVAKSVLDQIVDAQRFLEDYGNLRVGDLKILSIPGPTLFFLPDLIRRFAPSDSRITISLLSWPTPNVVNWISNHQTGIGLAEWEAANPFVSIRTFALPVSCAMCRHHPMAQKEVLTPHDLHDQDLAVINSDHQLYKDLEVTFREHGCAMNVRIQSDLFVPQFSLLPGTRIVGVVDPINIRNYDLLSPEKGEIVFRPFAPETHLHVSVITPAFGAQSKVEEEFEKLLAKELGKLEKRGIR